MADVSKFLDRPFTAGATRDYAEALASYVRGVLIKDGTGGATLPPAEAVGLYGAALETLAEFDRPLPRVICGLIRLATNDFSTAEQPTGFRRLDECNRVLAPVVGSPSPEIAEDGNQASVIPAVKLCPIDRSLDAILTLSAQSETPGVSLENYRRASEDPSLTSQDRAKLHALHALAALRAGVSTETQEALRQLRNVYPFDDWASQQLERIGD